MAVNIRGRGKLRLNFVEQVLYWLKYKQISETEYVGMIKTILTCKAWFLFSGMSTFRSGTTYPVHPSQVNKARWSLV